MQPPIRRHAVARVIDDGRGAHRPRRDIHVLADEWRDDAVEDRRRSAYYVLVVHLVEEGDTGGKKDGEEGRSDGCVKSDG